MQGHTNEVLLVFQKFYAGLMLERYLPGSAVLQLQNLLLQSIKTAYEMGRNEAMMQPPNLSQEGMDGRPE